MRFTDRPSRNRVPSVPVYSTTAKTYFTALSNAGYTATRTEKSHLNKWFNAGSANGWYAKLYDFGIMTWNSSAPCLVRGKVGGSITQAGGSVSYASQRATLSSNGYFNLGHTPTTAGFSTSGACFGCVLAGTITDGSGADMGSNSGANSWLLQANQFTVHGTTRMGNGTTAATSGGTSGNKPGLYVANRSSTSNIDIVWHNGTKTTIASRTDASGGTLTTINMFLGAWNNAGTPGLFANRGYSFWFTGTGFTSTECDNFAMDTYTLLTALGAL